MIYFDYAATSLGKPECVINAVVRAMQTMGNCGRSAGEQSLNAARMVYEAREKLAGFFGCENPRNVVFTCNATESLNITIQGTLKAGDHVITTDLEHNSVLRPLYALEKEGLEISFLRADEKGCVCYDDLEELIKPNTRAIICTHASNLTGNLLDIEKIGLFAKAHNLLFIVDASQTAGVFPIDMKRMHIDILAFTGHKSMLGPQGTGGLCVADGIVIEPLKRGGSGVQSYLKEHPAEMPTRLEAGTLNAHGIAGLSAAVSYIQDVGMDNIREKEQLLARRFLEGIRDIDGIKIYGDFTGIQETFGAMEGKSETESEEETEKGLGIKKCCMSGRAPIIALNWKDVESTELADALMEEYGIATRAGAHCAPRMHQALGTVEQGAVRFSFGYANTLEEVDQAVKALKELCR